MTNRAEPRTRPAPVARAVAAMGALAATLLALAPSAMALPELSGSATAESVPDAYGLSTVVFDLTVKNGGDQDALSVCVDIFLDIDGSPKPTSTSLDEAYFDAVYAKQSTFTQLTVVYVSPGPHSATIFVDSCEIVAEGNESDNLVVVPFEVLPPPPPGADLLVEEFTVEVDGDIATYEATLRNAGLEPAGKFSVDVFPDLAGPPAPGTTSNPFEWVDGLGPGKTTVLSFPSITLPQGTHQSWLLVDSLEFITETNKANNVAGPIQTNVGTVRAEDYADLFLKDLEVSVEGATVTFTLAVGNVGKLPAPASRLAVVFDGGQPPDPSALPPIGVALVDVPAIAPGASAELSASWNGAPQGTHSSWVLLDIDGDVLETNEENNLTGPVPVHVTGQIPLPDLAITDFRAEIEGYTVTYEVDVKNIGSMSSGPYDVDVFYDSKSKPNVYGQDVPAGQFAQDPLGLAPQESRTLTLVFGTASPGTMTSWAVVDALNLLAEEDEKNNDAGPLELDVAEVFGPDLQVEEFKVSLVGNDVLYIGKILNGGDEPCGAFDVDVVYDSETLPPVGERGDGYRTIEGLAPGESADFSVALNGADGGVYVSWLIVDTLKQVQETSEGNNVAGPRNFEIDTEALQCEGGALLSEPCICGDDTVSSGYCCGLQWSALPCPPDETDSASFPEADASDAHPFAGKTEPKVAGAPLVEQDVGCSTTGSAGSHALAMLVLLLVLVWPRIRH